MAKKPKAPRRKRFDLKKALFVLPNAFTASSIFCGFFAIITCTANASPDAVYKAALAIFYGMLLDMSDGRVARLTKTQSEFGREFDSLADVITFGIAPAVLVYRWGLDALGRWGMFISFLFAVSGAIRLARFNVLAIRDPVGSGKHFVGVPIPLAAAALVSLAMVHHQMGLDTVSTQTLVVLVIMLSYLMVSTVRYRTFKDLKLNRRSGVILLSLLGLVIYFSIVTRPSVVMMVFVWGYIAVGMVEEVVFFRRRRRLAAPVEPELEGPPQPEPQPAAEQP